MFRMTVDDIFVIRGRGLVATGQVAEGAVSVGDELQVNGSATVRVKGIEMFRKVVDQAKAGDNVGLLFGDLDRSDVKRGDVLTGAGDPADTGLPPAPPPPAAVATSGRDPRFAATEEQRAQFLNMRQAGLMTDAQIDDALHAMRFSAGGREWLLKAGSDAWYSSTGGDFSHDTPPSAS